MPHRPPDPRVLDWVEDQLGAAVVGAERLTGGITADVDRLTLAGGRAPVVLRRWTDPETWPEHLVEREAAALDAVDAVDATVVPAPRLLATDAGGHLTGVPSLLMTQVAGRVELTPTDRGAWLDDLARMLATIHRQPPTLAARVIHEDAAPDLHWLIDHGLRRDCLDIVETAASRYRDDEVFTHGDYQHFNILWQDGRLSGVVDWPNAGTGPRGRDVGHCCLNLAVLVDPPTAVEFLQRYEREAGVTPDPVVVVRALLAFEPGWLEFIPRQVAGRAPLDGPGMAGRVTTAIRCILQRSD